MRITDIISAVPPENLFGERQVRVEALHIPAELHVRAWHGDLIIGHAIFGQGEAGQCCGLDISVRPDWRRRGVATALVRRAVKLLGCPLDRADIHSDEGEALWQALLRRWPGLTRRTIANPIGKPSAGR